METLAEVRSLLDWDQVAMMPAKAARARGDQNALISSLIHEWLTDPALIDLLSGAEAEQTDDPIRIAGLRNLRREVDQAVKVPASLVEALERARASGHVAWIRAREANDYALFKPALDKLIRLAQNWSDCLSAPGHHPYDALLDVYEPGSTIESVAPLLDRLERELLAFLGRLGVLGRNSADGPRDEPAPALPLVSQEMQRVLAEEVLAAIGFDLGAGRLDTSVHPVTVSMGSDDVRVTTRYDEHDFLKSLGAVMHEGGHGLYAQGLPNALRGTFTGEPAGLALHESQSRFYENFIGGSLPFFKWFAQRARERGVPVDAGQLFHARNRVVPSLIRVDADEATYNLHVIVRFRLEVALVEGSLDVDDLEAAWNNAYVDKLGIRPTSARNGVLQDVHWAEGIFGYFPTYALGNLFAASLGAAVEADLADLWHDVEIGRFGAFLDWLRERVHSKAHLFDSSTIVKMATGERDAVEDLMTHLRNRHGRLHGLVSGSTGL
jgi:carboxypeptidase Taq